jgi:type IV secretory pathway VirB3-like protein
MHDHRATIYPTCWKKTMVLGVPRDFLMFLLLACALTTVFVHPLISIGFALIGWAIGKLMVKHDPFFMTVWIVKRFRIGVTRGGNDGNEYLP